MGSTKLNKKILEKTLPMSLNFCCDIWTVGSEFVIHNMKEWIHPVFYLLCRLLLQVWCGVGDVFLSDFRSLTTSCASLNRHSLPEDCC